MLSFFPTPALWSLCRGAGVVVVLTACSPHPEPLALEVLSWTGDDGTAVALDQILRVEFAQPLAQPFRASSVELLDEGGRVVAGIHSSVVGRWLYLEPRLPLSPDLSDGSLLPQQNYAIHLFGLPWLRALRSADGHVLAQDLMLRFHTLDAQASSALSGLGVESSDLRLQRASLQDPFVFSADTPLRLRFTRGLDPRSLSAQAQWRPRGQAKTIAVPMHLVANRYDFAEIEVHLLQPQAWGILELPAGLEGLGGWPLPGSDRILRCVPRPQSADDS